MKKIFEKINNSSRKSKVLAVVLTVVVCVTSIWHGFADKPMEVNAESAVTDKSYLEYVVDRMIAGLQDKFTILEIVPHTSQGEFRYYIGDDAVEEGLESNRSLMEEYYKMKGCWKDGNGKWSKTDEWFDLGGAFSNFGYQFIYNSETDTFEVESPKRFLNYVLMEYKELFEDHIELRTVEGNKLTEDDLKAADFIIISTGTHDMSTVACYNSFANPDIKTVNEAAVIDVNAYNGTVKADGTSDNMVKAAGLGDITYNSFEKLADGTYKSRDISWEMVELLWQYTIKGKSMELSDGTVIETAVPVVLDNQQFASLNLQGNMYKYQLLFRMLTETQFEALYPCISTKDTAGKTYINNENIVTGELSPAKNFPADADLTWNRENDVWGILGNPYNDAAAKSEYKDYNAPHADYLSNDYWVYNGNSCLIPANKDQNYYSGTGNDELGFYDRVGSLATVVDVMRYLLGAKDKPVIKHKQVRILEIQPCTVFDYDTYDEVRALANRLLLATEGLKGTDAEGNEVVLIEPLTEANYNDPNANTCIYVECMSSSAFNGINQDIVAEYDAVYMGMNDDLLLKNGDGKTIYNDAELNGYVYLAFGDLIKVKTGISMYYEEDYEKYFGNNSNGYELMGNNLEWNDRDNNSTIEGYESNKYHNGYTNVYKLGTELWNPLLVNTMANGYYYTLKNIDAIVSNARNNKDLFSSQAGSVRLSGNDITQLKADEIKEFINAGKLVVMADDIYNYTSASTTIYPTSNIAEVAQYAIDNNANRIIERRMGAMLLYIRNRNPKVEFMKMPTPIEHDANGNVNTFNDSGTFLNFELGIKGGANTKYRIKIFVDKNNDGVFDKSDDVTNDMSERYHSEDIVTSAEGTVGVSISVELSDNFNGLISYKLEIIELDGAGNEQPYRAGKTGYTVIKGDEKKDIKVLQIIPVVTKASNNVNLNLQTNAEFNNLLNQAADVINYNINVETVKTDEYEKWFADRPYDKNDLETTNHLEKYDMVVLGFADLYCGDDISDDNGALKCLNDFIDSGRAVLFTHDTISYANSVNGVMNSGGKLVRPSTNVWGTSLSRMFREKVGMDRYGISSAGALEADEFDNTPFYKDGSPVLYGLQGINNMLAYRHSNTGISFSSSVSNGKYKLYPYTTGDKSNYEALIETTQVKKLNEGQVTMYPYAIPDNLTVAETHGQWYQLDMEDPSIVVWYTLAGDSAKNSQLYADTDKDAGNNYYIYSKGNITYSGAGHSEMDSPEELKLFVNTVIKAITAGNNIPEVKVVESSYDSGTYTTYVTPYSGDYSFTFYGEDLDLIDYVGRFKTAKVTWTNSPVGDKVIKDFGNTLTDLTRITLNMSECLSGADLDYMDNLVDSAAGAYFKIELTDMYDAAGSVTVRLVKRDLFPLD